MAQEGVTEALAPARPREIPTIPRSAAISETRVPRNERSQAQTVSIDSPTTFNIDIAEATDAQEVERLVTRRINDERRQNNLELLSLISNQTEVGS